MADDEIDTAPLDETSAASPLFRKLKKWFRADREHSDKWRREAEEDFAFVAGDQWSAEDIAHLKETMRPVITFNRVHPIINSVVGHEINSKQEVRYIPREEGDVQVNELLTEGSRWFRDQSDADDEDTEAFYNAVICGMGWTDTTLDYEANDAGDPSMDSPDPLEMYWDCNARKKNLTDRKRHWRVKQMPLSEAEDMFPGASYADLHAAWATAMGDGSDEDQDRARLYEDDERDRVGSLDADRDVTMVHVEYKTKKTVYVVADPTTGQTMEMGVPQYRQFRQRAQMIGMPVHSTRRQRSVVMQAWLGGKVLDHREGLCKTHFRYQCVTAYPDKNKRTFFGMVRGMKDPQRWANKWMAQALYLLNAQAQGGVMVEAGAVDDMREFERTWTRVDKATVVPPGTLSSPNGPKIVPKTQGPFPAGFFQLMEFAISAIRDVPGVSMEMLGMREADQPASLELQRRQSGMIILAPLFQNLKRYRHDQGEVMLYLIQNYLSDGRLVRIMGEQQARYVPLIRQADVKYDIIIDDMPTSPNQKEMVWAMIGQNFWNLPPSMQLALLEYSPFPSTVVQKVREAAQAESQGPMAQLQQRMAALEAALKQADIGLKQAQTAKTTAEAQNAGADAGNNDGVRRFMADMAKTRANTDLQREKQAGELALKRDGMMMDVATARSKAELGAKTDILKAAIAARAQRAVQQKRQANASHR